MPREYRIQQHRGPASGIDYQAELNESQYSAVTSPPGAALVIAGAGSGKTRTLTYRVAYLLDNGIPPENILLLTFTNKAAREMLERVSALVSTDTNRLWGGTFHSIGNRILRLNAQRLGYQRGFSIMDREDQKDLMESVLAGAELDVGNYRFPKADVLIEMFSLALNVCVSLHELIEERYPYFGPVEESIQKVRELYERKKQETNTMDFDDLLVRVVDLLRDNVDVREYYQRQFQFVLVDEYQDTNKLQCDMVDLLCGENGNLMVVGDDAQSIYSWRGADVGNILNFQRRYPKAKTFKIETNYRSVPEVLALANASIANNSAQIPKTLLPARSGGKMTPALVSVDTPSAQAAFVAQRILELHEEGVELDEIAVLYRAHFHSLEIQMELTSRGIPFQITSGLRFFEQAHVKDVAAFMKFAVNRRDEVSFMRLVRLLPGVGNASASRMWSAWLASDGVKDGPLAQKFSALLMALPAPKKAQETWQQYAWTLDELVDEVGTPVAPASMIHSVTEGVYGDYMRTKFKNAEQREQDLDQLSAFASRFSDATEFLSQLALLTGVDTEGNQPGAQPQEKEAVTLTTTHQAKGLEWKIVFAVWLADGMFPHRRAIDDGGPEALEEERRLFYVTVTRAKDELYLVFPVINHQARDGNVLQRASRFIEELPDELVDPWKITAGW
ncbi:MAG: ATP-dependent helicase [Verrucomicrobiaceae bacterium]|nr:ATP-dependent helicase [Verrucomicrobiaceae bacterium]